MWFGPNFNTWPGGGLPLLIVSCVALVGALNVWVVRDYGAWWLRWSTAADAALPLMKLQAGDLTLFVEGHLIACWTFTVVLRGRPLTAMFQKTEILPFSGLLMLDTVAVVLLQSGLLYPWRYFGLGLGAGLAATIVDFGMRRRPWWFLWASVTAAVAILITYVTSAYLGNADLFGFYLKFGERTPEPDRWATHTHLFLECGTFFYWLWWLMRRLAMNDEPDLSQLGDPPVDGRSSSRQRFVWANLGTGYRRVLRLVIAWPALFALSLFIFTPWLEAYWRIPPSALIPLPLAGPNAFAELVAFSDSLDWSMTGSRKISEIPTADGERFYQANRRRIGALEDVLGQPSFPKADYALLASWMPAEQEESLKATMAALLMIHTRALLNFDLLEQYDSAQLMLLLARPFRRNVLLQHHVLGRSMEETGMNMVFDSRAGFDTKMCQSLIAQLHTAAAWEDSAQDVCERDANWVLAIRGWRDRVERACYPAHLFNDRYLESFEKEHQALRATLICELALRHYALDHEVEHPQSLDDLVPKYLSAVPADPFSDGPVLYHKSGTGPIPYFVYSVGYNGRSDDGAPWDNQKYDDDRPDDISIAHKSLDALRESLKTSWGRDVSPTAPADDTDLELPAISPDSNPDQAEPSPTPDESSIP